MNTSPSSSNVPMKTTPMTPIACDQLDEIEQERLRKKEKFKEFFKSRIKYRPSDTKRTDSGQKSLVNTPADRAKEVSQVHTQSDITKEVELVKNVVLVELSDASDIGGVEDEMVVEDSLLDVNVQIRDSMNIDQLPEDSIQVTEIVKPSEDRIQVREIASDCFPIETTKEQMTESLSVIEEKVHAFFQKRPSRKAKEQGLEKTRQFYEAIPSGTNNSGKICKKDVQAFIPGKQASRKLSASRKGKQKMQDDDFIVNVDSDDDFSELQRIENHGNHQQMSRKVHSPNHGSHQQVPRKVHSFFMTKQQKKEQRHIERTIQFQKEIQESKKLTMDLNKDKNGFNPFFEAKAVCASSTVEIVIPYDLLDYPLKWQAHVQQGVTVVDVTRPNIPFSVRRTTQSFDVDDQSGIKLRNNAKESTWPQYIVKKSSKLLDYPIDASSILESRDTQWNERLVLKSKSINGKNIVSEFSGWIETWATNPNYYKPEPNPKKKKKRDDFIADTDEESDEDDQRKIALLLGPVGCGKTTLVHTIAKKYGFEVLECNTSQLRSGKAVQDMLGDATTSHSVLARKVPFFSSSKSTKKPSKENDRSLVLIDDVDVVLEDDKGFWAAIQSMASTSKCPIVFTATQSPFYEGNEALAPGYNTLSNNCTVFELQEPSQEMIIDWMGALGFYHGYHLDRPLLAELVSKTLSQSLLQLQFFCTGLLKSKENELLSVVHRLPISKYQSFIDTCTLTPCLEEPVWKVDEMTSFAPVIYEDKKQYRSDHMIRTCVDLLAQYEIGSDSQVFLESDQYLSTEERAFDRLDVLYEFDSIRSIEKPTAVKIEYAPFMSVMCRYDAPSGSRRRSRT